MARVWKARCEDSFDAYERMISYYDRHKTGDLMSRLVSDLFDILRRRIAALEYRLLVCQKRRTKRGEPRLACL